MSLSKTSPRRLTAAERRQKSVRLRREGMTLDRIAEELGCSRPAVIKHLRFALATLAETTQAETAEWRAMELERLDALHRAVWDQALAGELPAVDRVLRIMERRARMLALDGPQKATSATSDGDAPNPAAAVVLPPTAPGVEEWLQQYGPPSASGHSSD